MATREPEQASIDPDEPQTPFWLTLLGGALFLAGALFLLAGGDDEPAPGDQVGDTAAAEGAAEAD